MKNEMNLPMPELFEVKATETTDRLVKAVENGKTLASIYRAIGYRWQETVEARFEKAACVHCLNEDLAQLGLAPSAVGFLWEVYRKDKTWTQACYESDYMNEQIALEQAAEMLNSFRENVVGLVSAGTPLIYDILGEGRGPFGYEGHKPEIFLEAVKTQLAKEGIRVLSAAEYVEEQSRNNNSKR